MSNPKPLSNPNPFTPESLLDFRWTSDPQIAPDGTRVVWVEQWVEEIEKDGKQRPGYRSAIWLSDAPDATASTSLPDRPEGPASATDRPEPRRLTYAAKGNDNSPRWSPDGSMLAFLSTRDGDKAQIWLLPLDGGEARQVTDPKELSEGVESFEWHPSGHSFCFTSRGHKSEDDKQREERDDEKVYQDRLPFKFNGAGLLDERRAQLWTVEADGSGLRQLTRLNRSVSEPAWSPDGRRIAFAGQTDVTPEHQWIGDLFVIDPDGGAPQCLTRSDGRVFAPAWSRDSRTIVFLGHTFPAGLASTTRLWAVDRDGGEPRCLTPHFDGEIGEIASGDSHLGGNPRRPAWTAGGLVFEALVHGHAGLYRLTPGSEPEELAVDGLSLAAFSANELAIAFTAESGARSAEVYTLHDGRVARRSKAGDAFFGAHHVRAPEHIRFPGAGGFELDGWLIRPDGAGTDNRRHPLILYVHGGPHTAYGDGFFHEFQVLAEAGFGVLYTNPRGSSSYGQDFAGVVRQHFGETDWDDVMAAADYGAELPWVDQHSMGIMGGSYGGYIVNWTITHTDRFAAACTQRSISNLVSFAGTSDIATVFSLDEYGALPWTDEEKLMSKSPIRYIANCKTPTLILHQEADHRCPIEQAEQLYTALVVLGVPARFVRFPGENHEMPRAGQPQRRINRMKHILDWFGRYLKG